MTEEALAIAHAPFFQEMLKRSPPVWSWEGGAQNIFLLQAQFSFLTALICPYALSQKRGPGATGGG